MKDFLDIYRQVYRQGKLFAVNKKIANNPLRTQGKRKNSVAVMGGILGDEGKGRISDELTAQFLKKNQQVVHYRDNGGSNAGHTVQVGEVKIALHQLGSGVLQKGCVVVMGKEMVIHPEDLVMEIEEVLRITGRKTLATKLVIDELAFLCLDTHRAFEAVLKEYSTGGKGSTGRGIAPAYADVIYRHPLQMRDLFSRNWKQKAKKHYQLYQGLIEGLGFDLKSSEAPRLDGRLVKIGNVDKFLKSLESAKKVIAPFVQPAYHLIEKSWQSSTPMVFEKAQALGLDKRWGVYPDVTASDCSFDGIFSSTAGVVDPNLIALKIATIKATYTSSVGSRRLPTLMKGKLAHQIREDANEYGATTKRPRDIAYIDLPMMSYLFRVGRVDYLAMTHLDICYPDLPIKVCVGYTRRGQVVGYQPDQEFLNGVEPRFIDLPSWDGVALQSAKKISDLPKEALQYIAFISQCLGAQMLIGTTGPSREQTIRWF